METEASIPCSQQPATASPLSQMNPAYIFTIPIEVLRYDKNNNVMFYAALRIENCLSRHVCGHTST
jgi:hypothetical protein